MTDREPIPTFQNKWDRLTFLAHSYRFYLALALLATLAALIYVKPTVDVPDTYVATLGAFVLVGIGAGPGGFYIARWLRRYRAVTVHHVNAVDDTLEKWYVPPAVWEDKTVANDRKPWPVNDGDAYAVRKFDWYDSTDTLVVEGCWLSESAADDLLMTDRSHMQDIHDFLLDAYRALGKFRGRWDRMAMQVEKQTINSVHEAQEKGRSLNAETIQQVWDDVADEIDDEMPSDPPTVDDLELGDPPDADLDEQDIPRDQVTPDEPVRKN